MQKNSRLKALFLATAAVVSATPAFAQVSSSAASSSTTDASQQGVQVEEVVVTGSRISLPGYTEPTPVTVVGTEQLQRDNYLDVPTVLNQIPSISISSPSTSGGGNSISGGNFGLATANLRGLGVNRTLVLFDGVRTAPSDVGGDFDIDMIPSSVIKRIDVVTAGASAAWGSNAVAGVINVILDKTFTGLKFNAEVSSNQLATSQRANFEASYGTDLFGGRGHLILSGSFLYSPDAVTPTQVPWWHSQYLINNPAATATNGLPALIHAQNVGLASYTQGGLVTSGPLKGLQFLQGGQPAQFNFGQVSGSVSSGGTYAPGVFNGIEAPVVNPLNDGSLFADFRYRVADNVNASLQVNYSDAIASASTTPYTRQNNLPIQIDNAYLPASVVASMQQAGITSFNLSTTNANNVPGIAGQDYKDKNGLGVNWEDITRSMLREVGHVDVTFGDWLWSTDIQHSSVSRPTTIYADPIISNYNNAVDAVYVTQQNVGRSGLTVGSIACRSTLTTPTNGCVPLDVLGVGVASQSAITYVDGAPGSNKADLSLEQRSADTTIQGPLFSLPAGKVAVAAGLTWRLDSLNQQGNALANALAYAVGNYPSYAAHESVWEGFAETDVPLLKDTLVKDLSFNGAVRYTDYSVSGSSVTWKAGLNSQVTEDIRLRATSSSDIRAPSLSDLFSPPTNNLQVVSDPARNNATTNIYLISQGNQSLKPEIGRTNTAGVVLTPTFVPGLVASVDWYRIVISNALAAPGQNYTLQQCAAGIQTFCALEARDANGVLLTISGNQLNIAKQSTSGEDLQVDYTTDFWQGQLSGHAVFNHIEYLISNSLGTINNPVGSYGVSTPGSGPPHWKGNAELTYKVDNISGTLSTRFVGAGKYNALWELANIDNNDIPEVFYLDLRGSYTLGDNGQYQIYGAIDNAFDKDPPIIPYTPTGGNPGFYLPTRLDLYDALGRTFRLGVRVSL